MAAALCSCVGRDGDDDRGGVVGDVFDDLFFTATSDDARRLGAGAPPKCKSAECRAAALGLLLALAEAAPAVALTPLANLLLLRQQFDRAGGGAAGTWHYQPAALERAQCGYVGLKNLGATCYVNSLAQQLFLIPELRAGSSPPTPPPPDDTVPEAPPAAGEPNRPLLRQLQLLFGNLHESQRKYYDMREFCNSFRDFEGAPINPAIQMDVDEFLSTLFDQLEGAIKGTGVGEVEAQLLQRYFGGLYANQITSNTRGKLAERLETFYTVSVDVKGKRSVLDGLAQACEGEVLDGDNKYKIDATGEYVEAIKRQSLHTLPPVLILHLKRFEFNFDTMRREKCNDHVEFPMTINMEPYTVGYIERKEAAAAAGEPAPPLAATPAAHASSTRWSACSSTQAPPSRATTTPSSASAACPPATAVRAAAAGSTSTTSTSSRSTRATSAASASAAPRR